MNLAKRLDELARKKAEMEAGEESDDDLPQADWPVRQGKVSQPRGPAHPSRDTSRQMEQDEGEEEEEEMEENGMDDEREEDELHLSSKQGMFICSQASLLAAWKTHGCTKSVSRLSGQGWKLVFGRVV